MPGRSSRCGLSPPCRRGGHQLGGLGRSEDVRQRLVRRLAAPFEQDMHRLEREHDMVGETAGVGGPVDEVDVEVAGRARHCAEPGEALLCALGDHPAGAPSCPRRAPCASVAPPRAGRGGTQDPADRQCPASWPRWCREARRARRGKPTIAGIMGSSGTLGWSRRARKLHARCGRGERERVAVEPRQPDLGERFPRALVACLAYPASSSTSIVHRATSWSSLRTCSYIVTGRHDFAGPVVPERPQRATR